MFMLSEKPNSRYCILTFCMIFAKLSFVDKIMAGTMFFYIFKALKMYYWPSYVKRIRDDCYFRYISNYQPSKHICFHGLPYCVNNYVIFIITITISVFSISSSCQSSPKSQSAITFDTNYMCNVRWKIYSFALRQSLFLFQDIH